MDQSDDNMIVWVCQLCHRQTKQVHWWFSRPVCEACWKRQNRIVPWCERDD